MKKKIVFILPSLKGGGAEKVVINIINSLDTSRLEIFLMIICPAYDYLPLITAPVKLIKLEKNSTSAGTRDIYRVLKEMQPDVVFTTLNHISIVSILLRRFTGGKYINVVRLPTLPSNKLGAGWKGKVERFLNTRVLRHAHHVIAQTQQMKDEAEQFYGIPATKVRHIPNLVNSKQIETMGKELINVFDKSRFNIVAAGSLYSAKGFDVLIKAMPRVIRVIPNARLHILGRESVEPGYGERLRALAGSLSLYDEVLFHGFKSNPYPYFKEADLFVLSSRKEGFPNVVLEALLLGTPVVATSCVDFKGIIETGTNGFTVPVEDENSLATAIVKARNLEAPKLAVRNFDYSSFFMSV
ncbi:glycosyltransferase [Chitinophaga sp. Cy-1792]|uniref:glycosyltransferase n=1 Tax=Chitinophaga sp. Cy-1792 TaxID=2608339 RepID=UPI0014208336|nr:glycosyltransferase [Chitinophaga sp. Cy-1792]NIG55225.1 glycosyltransferase [Chitinophaga sp. Cy-1792]